MKTQGERGEDSEKVRGSGDCSPGDLKDHCTRHRAGELES